MRSLSAEYAVKRPVGWVAQLSVQAGVFKSRQATLFVSSILVYADAERLEDKKCQSYKSIQHLWGSDSLKVCCPQAATDCTSATSGGPE